MTAPEEEKQKKTSRRRLLQSAIVFSAVGAGMMLGFGALATPAPTSASDGESAPEAPPQASSGGGGSSNYGASLSVKVRYYQMRDALSTTEDNFVLESPAHFSDLMNHIVDAHPVLATMAPTMVVLIDGLIGLPGTPLKDGDEVDLLPALAGG